MRMDGHPLGQRMLRKPIEANTMALNLMLLHIHYISWTGRNSNQSMTYSWAVELDAHRQGQSE